MDMLLIMLTHKERALHLICSQVSFPFKTGRPVCVIRTRNAVMTSYQDQNTCPVFSDEE